MNTTPRALTVRDGGRRDDRRRGPRGQPRAAPRADDSTTWGRLTKEEKWSQALRDLRTVYDLGDAEAWHAATYTLWSNARYVVERSAAARTVLPRD